MRRLLPLLATTAAAIAIAGCGGGDDGKSPLDNALGYLPEDTPFAAAVETDLEASQFETGQDLVKKFPLGERLLNELKDELEGQDVDFEDDVKPLLGNPAVIGSPDAQSFLSDDEDTVFVGAIETKDKGKLEQLVEDQDAKKLGEKEGAKIYRDPDSDDTFAVKDDVLIIGDSRETIEKSLEQRMADDRLSEGTFDDALADLPDDALVRVYSDLQGLLESDPDTQDARKVKWVGALRTLGLTGSVKSDQVDVDFNLATDSGDLSDEDVPIATGSESPNILPEPGRISVGLRDPVQGYKFVLDTARSIDSEGTSEFETALSTIESRLHVDRQDDLLDQLDGDVNVNFDINGKFAVRAEVKDPQAVQQALRKVARGLPAIARSGGDILGSARRGPFYALASPSGTSVVFGVVGGDLVVSNDGARAGQVAQLSSEQVSGAEGSVVVQADTRKVVTQLLRRVGLEGVIAGSLFTGPLGDVTGSLNADTDGIRGKLSQEID